MEKLYVISCNVLWRELCYYAALSPHSYTFHFLKQGLHNTPDILRSELQNAIDTIPPDEGFSAILIGYGLCSNGIEGITSRHTKLVIMRGHDCITFLLGSKERYKSRMDESPGTYWYSPGWIETGFTPGKETYKKLLETYTEKYGSDNAAYLMEMEQGWQSKYSAAAYIDLGFHNTDRYRNYTWESAKWLGWRFDDIAGDPHLVMDFLEGRWNGGDFLIVKPGETVAASHDDSIIKTNPIFTDTNAVADTPENRHLSHNDKQNLYINRTENQNL